MLDLRAHHLEPRIFRAGLRGLRRIHRVEWARARRAFGRLELIPEPMPAPERVAIGLAISLGY
jgi:hypothetical protein